MMKPIRTGLICASLALAAGMPASGQEPYDAAAIRSLAEEARSARDLARLNEVRIKLRQVDYRSLAGREEKEWLIEAYRLLAWSHRNHRYIRPGYDLLVQHLALRDELQAEVRQHRLDSLRTTRQARVDALKDSVAATESTEKTLLSEKAELDRARSAYLLIRILLVIAVVVGAAVWTLRLRRRTAVATAGYESNGQRLLELQEPSFRGQMTAGVLYHAQVLNQRLHAETEKLARLMPGIEEGFSGVRETEPVLKSAMENLGRMNKLVEMNTGALQAFFEKLPVYKMKPPPVEP